MQENEQNMITMTKKSLVHLEPDQSSSNAQLALTLQEEFWDKISLKTFDQNNRNEANQDTNIEPAIDNSKTEWAQTSRDNGNKDENTMIDDGNLPSTSHIDLIEPIQLIEKSVIVHRDENGFGLQIRGESPIYVEHVHDNGSAWRAGVRSGDRISKINGISVHGIEHKNIVLMFKHCSRFIALTIITNCNLRQGFDAVGFSPLSTSSSDSSSNMPSSSSATSKSTSQSNFIIVPNNNTTKNRTSKIILTNNETLRPSLGTLVLREQINSINSSQYYNERDATNLTIDHKNQNYLKQNDNPQQHQINLNTINPIELKDRVDGIKSTLGQQTIKTIIEDPKPGVSSKNSDMMPSSSTASFREHTNSLVQYQLNRDFIVRNNLNSYNIHGPITSSYVANRLFSRNRTLSTSYRPHSNISLSNKAKISNENVINNQQDTNQNQSSPEGITNNSIGSGGAKQEIKEVSSIPQNKLGHSASANSFPIDAAKNNADLSNQGKEIIVNKRLEIIRELINTEKAHTDRLCSLYQLFYKPLRAGGHLSPEQLRAVFSCHQTLFKVHRSIYKSLLSANYGFYKEPMIGSVLVEIFEGPLKRRLQRAACAFCAAQATNSDILNKLTRKDTKAGELVAQITSQQITGRLGIKDLLASCFQRLAKYPLLLERLLKATPENPPNDLEPLSSVFLSKIDNPDRISVRLSQQQTTLNESSNVNTEAQASNKSSNIRNRRESNDDTNYDHRFDRQRQHARRMLAISLAEEREYIERALIESRAILVKVNESVEKAIAKNKLREIWKRTDKYPGVPLVDVCRQHLLHDGLLTLRLSKRTYDIYMLLLDDYIILLTREGQDKYRLKFFTSEGKFVVSQSSAVYSPVFVIDEHLATREAATDRRIFYLLCKRKDDSRIYEFTARSEKERLIWCDRIQAAIERQLTRPFRRPSCESSITKSSSGMSKIETDHETPAIQEAADEQQIDQNNDNECNNENNVRTQYQGNDCAEKSDNSISDTTVTQGESQDSNQKDPESNTPGEGSQELVGTISYVLDDGIVEANEVTSTIPATHEPVHMTFKHQEGIKA